MTDQSRTTDGDHSQGDRSDGVGRRKFVALGAGASAAMLAGCAGDGGLAPSDGSDGTDDSDGSDGAETLTGNFRLLISDAPADIGDFDRLDVTLGEARIFEATEGGDGEDDEREQTGNETEGDDPANGTAEVEDGGDADDEGDEEGGEEPDDDEDDDGSDRGFTVVDLDGATVDLTQVIEEDAMAVFDGEIPAGEYEKIEHSVTAIEGIVGGEEVDVKLPSEKLQITSGFAVAPDESVSFVFDINVVKRGRNNGYILKPVISGSGVAGRDVEVNEVGKDDEDDGGENGETETDGSEDGEDDGSTSDGTETDDEPSDAEDGTTANGTDN